MLPACVPRGAHDRWATQLLSWASPTSSSQLHRCRGNAPWWTPESGLCARPRRCGDTRHHGWAPKTHNIIVLVLGVCVLGPEGCRWRARAIWVKLGGAIARLPPAARPGGRLRERDSHTLAVSFIIEFYTLLRVTIPPVRGGRGFNLRSEWGVGEYERVRSSRQSCGAMGRPGCRS